MNKPLYEKLYSFILQEIISGQLKSGDRVPSEKELAEQFRVSRITSKKALEILSQAGVVQRIRGKGSFVSDHLPDPARLHSMLGTKMQVSKAENKMIALIIPDFSDTYGTKLVHSIEKKCSEKNCHLVIRRTYGKREEEENAIQSLLELDVDGLIVFPVHGEHYNTKLLQLVIDEFPLVLVDRYLKGIPACAIYTDNQKASEELTAFLLEKGHQHVAFLSPPEKNTSTIEERIQGFSMALSRHGLRLNPAYLLTDLFSTLPACLSEEKIDKDKETLRAFVESSPDLTAFVVCEFNLANILSQVLKELGRADQYEVVCFDALNDSQGNPMYTHIQQDETSIGETAVKLLLCQINGGKVSLNNVVKHLLVKRN